MNNLRQFRMIPVCSGERRFWFTLSLLIGSAPCAAGAEELEASFAKQAQPILTRYCVDCHGPSEPKGMIDFSQRRTEEQFAAEPALWFRVLDRIESGTMPPKSADPLPAESRQNLARWIRGELTDRLADKRRAEGRSRSRRLNRKEYANTMEDLLGVRPSVTRYLPTDGLVDGYDKIGSALPLSSEGAAGYVAMAEEILNKWTALPIMRGFKTDLASRTLRAEAMESGESPGHSLKLDDGTIVSFNSDTTSGRLKFNKTRLPGKHRLRMSVYGYQTDQPMVFGVYAGNTSAYPQILTLVKVLEAPPKKAAVVECEVYLWAEAGLRLIPFGLGVQVPKNTQAKDCRGPGLAVQWLEAIEPELPLQAYRFLTTDFPPALEGAFRNFRMTPAALNAAPPKKAPLISKGDLEEVMRKTFQRIGRHCYRRELTPEEVAPFVNAVVQDGRTKSFQNVVLDQVLVMLTSPEFLCLVEEPGKLPDAALASRLAYFLWNSTPDERLLELAAEGRLGDPATLREETERLLADPKSERFVEDFVNQWLGLRAIDDTSPDAVLYPEYNETLKMSSVWETQGTFRRMLQEDLSVRDFVAPDWMLVNEPLAKHYGLSGVAGTQLQRVDRPASSPFGGVWTQSAVMKVTANGTNTSPVKRGVWVASRLLGTPIPPPPPNIDPIAPDIRGAKTLREQLERHRSQASCAACHAKFDHFGFALESFDVIGGYREFYRVNPEGAGDLSLIKFGGKGKPTWKNGLPVDCRGKLPDGGEFADIRQLRSQVAAQPRRLAVGVVRHLATYATGEPATELDQPEIDRIVDQCADGNFGLRSLVHALVQSDLFRYK